MAEFRGHILSGKNGIFICFHLQVFIKFFIHTFAFNSQFLSDSEYFGEIDSYLICCRLNFNKKTKIHFDLSEVHPHYIIFSISFTLSIFIISIHFQFLFFSMFKSYSH